MTVCLSIPGRVTRVRGAAAEVESGAGRRWCSAVATPEVREGDWVHTHARVIVAIVTEEEARAAIETVRELDARLRAEQSEGVWRASSSFSGSST